MNYEVKIEESEKAGRCQESNPGHIGLSRQWSIGSVRIGGRPAVMGQWQNTGGSRCPGFDPRQLPAFSLSSISLHNI